MRGGGAPSAWHARCNRRRSSLESLQLANDGEGRMKVTVACCICLLCAAGCGDDEPTDDNGGSEGSGGSGASASTDSTGSTGGGSANDAATAGAMTSSGS